MGNTVSTDDCPRSALRDRPTTTPAVNTAATAEPTITGAQETQDGIAGMSSQVIKIAEAGTDRLSKMPIEVRNMIWKVTVSNGRIIFVQPLDGASETVKYIADIRYKDNVLVFTPRLADAGDAFPSFLHAGQQMRAELLTLMEKLVVSFNTTTIPHPIMYYPDGDLVCLSGYLDLGKFPDGLHHVKHIALEGYLFWGFHHEYALGHDTNGSRPKKHWKKHDACELLANIVKLESAKSVTFLKGFPNRIRTKGTWFNHDPTKGRFQDVKMTGRAEYVEEIKVREQRVTEFWESEMVELGIEAREIKIHLLEYLKDQSDTHFHVRTITYPKEHVERK